MRTTSKRSRNVRLVATALALVLLAAACEATPGEFTGDHKADQIYEDYESGNWYTAGQTTPIYTSHSEDMPVAGDYNGDLKWEPAVLRGTTWISSALADPIVYNPANMPAGPPATPGGANAATPPTLLPVPGDYDGKGKTVPAYYDQVDASWWIMGHTGSVQFGVPPTDAGNLGYDVPVPADYDGDAKTDIAVFRPTDGSFHYLSSKTGQEVVVTPSVPAGHAAIVPVPGDYDKVGHAEAAVTDDQGANWYVAGHTDPVATFPGPFPNADGYVPAPADYDGDGHVDATLNDPSNGAFWIIGQPRPARGSFGPNPSTKSAGAAPWAMLINFVRLDLYAERCILPSPPSGYC